MPKAKAETPQEPVEAPETTDDSQIITPEDTAKLGVSPEAPVAPAEKAIPPKAFVETKRRATPLPCSKCAWIGSDTELQNKSYITQKNPFFATAHAEDLFCPACGTLIIDFVKSREDETYTFYGYDHEFRKARIISREIRIRSLDPKGYDSNRRVILAQHGIVVPK